MRFGICCGPGSFAVQVNSQPLSSLPRLMECLHAAGADFVEFGVAAVTPEADEREFDTLRAALSGFALRVEAFNSFIPAKYRITGPDVNLAAVLKYCHVAIRRCKALGAEVIVLGSSGARKIPDGFDRDKAENQFIAFCRAAGPLAAESGVTIALEPLNKKEDNLLVSVQHGAELVDKIGHPNIQLLADLFHISEDKEPLEHVAAAGARLRHTHVADLGRAAPGFASNGEEDFIGFFRNLRRAGYDKRCSFEGKFDDIDAQCKPVLDLLKKRWNESQD